MLIATARRAATWAVLIGLLQTTVSSQEQVPSSLALVDLDGRRVAPFEVNPSRSSVFVFATFDCPISNRYAPEVRRLADEFSDARFWLVYPDASVPVGMLRQHVADYQYPFPALRDPQHALVALTGVRVTPEVAVFDSARRLVYRGRIDDRVVDFGKVRVTPTERDLEAVLEQLAAGATVEPRTTDAVGCYIPPL